MPPPPLPAPLSTAKPHRCRRLQRQWQRHGGSAAAVAAQSQSAVGFFSRAPDVKE
jgi:hypothetical protein